MAPRQRRVLVRYFNAYWLRSVFGVCVCAWRNLACKQRGHLGWIVRDGEWKKLAMAAWWMCVVKVMRRSRACGSACLTIHILISRCCRHTLLFGTRFGLQLSWLESDTHAHTQNQSPLIELDHGFWDWPELKAYLPPLVSPLSLFPRPKPGFWIRLMLFCHLRFFLCICMTKWANENVNFISLCDLLFLFWVFLLGAWVRMNKKPEKESGKVCAFPFSTLFVILCVSTPFLSFLILFSPVKSVCFSNFNTLMCHLSPFMLVLSLVFFLLLLLLDFYSHLWWLIKKRQEIVRPSGSTQTHTGLVVN